MSNFTRFLAALKGQRKTQLKTDVFLSIFRETIPNYDRDGDMGASMLREALEQLHSSGDIEYSKNKKTWSMIGRTSVPTTIRVRKNHEETLEEAVTEWDARIAPIIGSKTNATRQDLKKLDDFLKKQRVDPSPTMPLKARSLTIFGNEKKLELFLTANRRTFLDGALSMEDLACFSPASIYFAYETFEDSEGDRILLVENSETFHQMKTWNSRSQKYRAVAFGSGNTINSSVPALDTLLLDLKATAFDYFGDIDEPGIRIPLSMIKKHAQINRNSHPLQLFPALDLYRLCLSCGKAMPVVKGADTSVSKWNSSTAESAKEWFNDDTLHGQMDKIISKGKRVAQEWLFTIETA